MIFLYDGEELIGARCRDNNYYYGHIGNRNRNDSSTKYTLNAYWESPYYKNLVMEIYFLPYSEEK